MWTMLEFFSSASNFCLTVLFSSGIEIFLLRPGVFLLLTGVEVETGRGLLPRRCLGFGTSESVSI